MGDSITYGYGCTAGQNGAWPNLLQEKISGDGIVFKVHNFGLNGTTAQKCGDKPYWKSPSLLQGLQYRSTGVTLITMMLGTNDAKKHNWTNEEKYTTDYIHLISTIMQLYNKDKSKQN